jgi:hypothetical protein
MLLKRIGLDNEINRRRVKVYDVTNKKLLETFESSREAADYTGIDPSHIANIIAHKRKNRTNKLGLTITFR